MVVIIHEEIDVGVGEHAQIDLTLRAAVAIVGPTHSGPIGGFGLKAGGGARICLRIIDAQPRARVVDIYAGRALIFGDDDLFHHGDLILVSNIGRGLDQVRLDILYDHVLWTPGVLRGGRGRA